MHSTFDREDKTILTGGIPIIPPLGNIGGGACAAKLKEQEIRRRYWSEMRGYAPIALSNH